MRDRLIAKLQLRQTRERLDDTVRLQIDLGSDPEDILQRLTVADLRGLLVFHCLVGKQCRQQMVDSLLDQVYGSCSVGRRVRQQVKQLFR
jgi:hypothetical protein